MQKCRTCNGQKFVYGMGNIKDKCKECDAKGFIDEVKIVVFDKEPAEEVFKENMVKLSPPKKPKEKGHDGKESR